MTEQAAFVDTVRGEGTGPRMEVLNPATGDVVREVSSQTVEEVVANIDALSVSYRRWAELPLEHRGAVLARCAAEIVAHIEELASTLTTEQGKTLKEARLEIGRCADTFRIYSELTHLLAPQSVEMHGRDAWTVKLPLGVVAAVVPWNFPLTLLANKLVPALLAGNGVVIKPAPSTPLTTSRLLDIICSCGVPEDAFTVVIGGKEAGEAIVKHSAVQLISVTGSTETGRAIMRSAADRVKRLTLELGGSDAMIVCDDADLESAARAAAVGRFFNCGQACIAVKRVFVHEDVADEFLERLVARAQRLKVGPGDDSASIVGPLHSARQLRDTLDLVEDAVTQGATVVFGGQPLSGGEHRGGFFIEPTVLTDVPATARILHEECFGPALPVNRFASLDEAIDCANESEFGLGSSIWTSDPVKAQIAISRLQAGNTWVNDMAIDHDELPFGGVKQSGFGKERGTEVLLEYVNLKSVVAAEGFLPSRILEGEVGNE